jgi:hypothetical protein
MSRPPKVYAVMDFKVTPGMGDTPFTFSNTTIRTQKSRPEYRVDLRKAPDAGLDDVIDALRRYQVRRSREPTAIRLHRKARLKMCGTATNPTLFGLKVTL